MLQKTTGNDSRRQGRFFYGWWIVGVASILGMFGNGAISSGFPRFFVPIRQDLGISSAQMSLVFSLARAEGGFGGPLVGWLVDRFGARPMVLFGGLMAGIGLMLLSRADTYWEFVFLFAGVVSLGKTASLGQTLMAAVNQWFIRRRALALSTLMTAFAAGGAFVVLLLDLGITHLGWRDTVFFTGVFIALLTLLASPVLRSRPEDMGLRPDGDVPLARTGTGAGSQIPDERDFTVRQAMRTPTFWLLLGGIITRVTASNAIIIHIFPILDLKGLDASTATLFVSAMFFMAIPLRFLLGVAGGRFAPRKMLFWGMNLGAVGLFALWGMPGIPGVVVFVVGLAVVEGIASVNWLMVGDYFGRSRFGSLMGAMSVFHNIGLFGAPIFAGWVVDTTGSYELVLLTFAPMFVASACFFALARRPVLPVLPGGYQVPVEAASD
ncbi:MAG TPA: MFS transporter [Dehalococcoidia bacterium]|nr:MFS transporter [Dehalococcoidia bacterium]